HLCHSPMPPHSHPRLRSPSNVRGNGSGDGTRTTPYAKQPESVAPSHHHALTPNLSPPWRVFPRSMRSLGRYIRDCMVIPESSVQVAPDVTIHATVRV